MPPLIRLESIGGDAPMEIVQVDHGVVTLGRELENSIVVDSDAVSRRHACVYGAETEWLFWDLESTNGSWLNGVRLNSGQIRLLRDGDVLQLADFPMRFVVVNKNEQDEDALRSKLVVFEDVKFSTEFPLFTEGASFLVGGVEGDLFVDGQDPAVKQLEIVKSEGRIELNTGQSSVPVLVNGVAAVSGRTVLADGDEVSIGRYRILLSDLRSHISERINKPGAGTSPQAARVASAYDRPNVPEHMKRRLDDSWEPESARRRASAGRKFIFGTPPQGEDPFETMSLRDYEFSSKAGFDLSSSQRFSGAFVAEDEDESTSIREYLQTVIGAVFVAILLGAGFFWLFM